MNTSIGWIGAIVLCIVSSGFSMNTTTGDILSENRMLKDTVAIYTAQTRELKSGRIPDSVFSMTELRSLYVMGMDCDYRELDAMGNDITQCWAIKEIPADIGRLAELEELLLPVNAISSLPKEIRKLKNLRVLDLTDNPISKVDDITSLTRLEHVSLCGANITEMPADLRKLNRLKRLCLAGNSISKLERQRIREALPYCDVVF